MNFSIISAVNDEDVLKRCLLSSPDLGNISELVLQRGFGNAADAYNEAMAQAKGEVLVFIHQDVYLPAGWFGEVQKAIEKLALTDPQWGVLGIYGVTNSGKYCGRLYCNANQCVLGQPVREQLEVATLDEVVLILRRDSGLKFDNGLKGFHLYGTDICLAARREGLKIYTVPGFCIHNANGYGMFPRSFWQAYFYMRRKWKSSLPIKTPCIEIERSLWPVLRGIVWRFCWLKAKRIRLSQRLEDPAKLYIQLGRNQNSVDSISSFEDRIVPIVDS